MGTASTMTSPTAIALFTRDLRIHDNPTLQGAIDSAEQVLPVFILDDAILGSAYLAPNRTSFLVEALRDLDESLKQRGANGLVVRRGDTAREIATLADDVRARTVHISGDWSAYAQHRQHRLEKLLAEQGRELVVTARRWWSSHRVPSLRLTRTISRCSRRTTAVGRTILGGRSSRLAGSRPPACTRIGSPPPRRCAPATAPGTCPRAARGRDAAGCRPGCVRR